jgi:uncharacterized membrane protein YdjX (TVP38/TMEM64 family)
MPYDLAALLVIFATAAVAFIASRMLSRKWREKRRAEQEGEQRRTESRQVRRARARREHK